MVASRTPDADEAPDVTSQPHRTVASLKTAAEVTSQLAQLISIRTLADLAGVTETRAVQEWASSIRKPRVRIEAKLRLGLQVSLLIECQLGPGRAEPWWTTSNPRLDDLTPARLLSGAEVGDVSRALMAAARSFVGA